jgi:hypothetical protein
MTSKMPSSDFSALLPPQAVLGILPTLIAFSRPQPTRLSPTPKRLAMSMA